MRHLKNLFLDELADIYDAEQRIVKGLARMAGAATCGQLKTAFSIHLEETELHVAKLEEVFDLFGEKPKGRKCLATTGLLAEAEALIAANEGELTINAALICAAQKVELHEIAAYGCLRDWAKLLQHPVAARILDDILYDEKVTDTTLNELAWDYNQQALLEETEQAKAEHSLDGAPPREIKPPGLAKTNLKKTGRRNGR